MGLKNEYSTDVMRPAAQGLLPSFEELLPVDRMIIPVQFQWQRNYEHVHNQFSLLVHKISKLGNFDFHDFALRCVTHRKPLNNVTAEERGCILVNAIEVSHKTQKIIRPFYYFGG